MRLTLAVLLALCPFPAEAREPVFDALSHLLNEYSAPVDQMAAEAAPDADSPPGAKLAQIQADLSLMAEGFETFRHPSHATQALKTLPDKIVPELRPFFKDRDSSLDTLYRTLAVTDYTWAARFPEPPCDPRARRRALLSSKDGLFTDPKTGLLSAWLARLLGPIASGRSAEDALDKASSKRAVTERDYELLRLKVRKIAEALESDKAVGAARSKLYCARAQAYEDLASAHRSKDEGPIQAANGLAAAVAVDREAASVVLMAIAEGPDQYRSLGAGVLVDTGKGPRVLTDARLYPERGEDKASLRAFARPEDGKTLGAPLVFFVEKVDPASGVMVGRLEGGERIPALKLAGAAPAQDDLVRAIGHMSGTGAWTVSQGLVTAAGKGAFTTDALLGPDMLGSPLLNGQGEVAGLAVLPTGTGLPAAVTAARLSEILEGGAQVSASSDIEFVESHNRGSASVLTAAMPTFGAGLTAPGAKPIEASEYIYSQTQWGTVRGKCMANCGGGSASSGSSYGGSSYDSGGKELGEALGKALAPVVEALIFKGIPALFRGIGKLFKGNGTAAPKAPSQPLARTTSPAPTPKPEPPPTPPKPKCDLTKVAAPTKAGAEPFAVSVRFTCDDRKIPLSGHSVKFTFEWDGKKSTQTITLPTDASGAATLVIRVSNDKTKVEFVRSTAAHSHDELDNYDPEARDPEEPAEPPISEVVHAEHLAAGRQPGPIEAADTVTVEKAAVTAVATSEIASAVTAGRVFTLAGEGAVLRVTATITLGGVATGVIVLVAAKQVFDIGWIIGSVAERKISDVQWGLKQYVKEDDCAFKPGEEVLNRFIDGTRLSAGYLQAHEGEEIGLGHTIKKHVKKPLEYLVRRLETEYKVKDASSFDDVVQAEIAIRRAIIADISNVSVWGSKRNMTSHETYFMGDASVPLGYGISLSDPLSKARLKYNMIVRLKQKPDCRIFILTAYPD